MGTLDILSKIRDFFEIGRKTTSGVKSNKPEIRNYDFNDGEKMPKTKSEYVESKNKNNISSQIKKDKIKDDDELEK